MARIRSIKPEFFRHEALFEAEQADKLPLRLAYIGLWTAADKEGRFKWQPRALKLDCLPYDSCDFSRVLDALATRGFIQKYEHEGQFYGFIPSWKAHQVINNRETESILPDPHESTVLTREARVNDASSTRLKHAQGEGKGKEGKGREGEREGRVNADISVEPVADKKQKLRTIPADFGISDAVRAWSAQNGFMRLSERLEHFTGYAKASGKTYADWDQAFMNAIRGDWANLNGKTKSSQSRHSGNDDWLPPELRVLPEKTIEAVRV